MRSQLCAALIAVGLALPAGAQGTNSGEVAADVGATDGRKLGLVQGRSVGRAQALYESFRDGFRQGLREARDEGGGQAYADRAQLQGRTRGLETGAVAGREAGAEASLEAWLAAGGRRPTAPRKPRVPMSSEEQAPSACAPAAPLRLPFSADLKVEINPDGLEERESPVVIDSFDLDFPADTDLRNRARAAGAVSDAVDFWVRDYKDAFQSAWHQTFENERSGTSLDARSEYEALGLDIGRKEGARRLACEAGRQHWQDGFDSGWKEAWSRAFEEAWSETDERHAKRAVVIVQDARLVDASGDGLLEPGEAAFLEARLVNAGAVEAKRAAGSWGAVRGFESEGHLEGGLGPGQTRDLKIDLGPSDATAPPSTSVVVRLRGLGSQPMTLSARLGRPARIERAEAGLSVQDGRLVARVETTVLSTSAASARAELELTGDGVTAPVGRLDGGESKTVSLQVPAELPEAIGSVATGVFVLRTRDGQPWHAGRWAATFGLEEAMALAGAGDAPPEIGARLVTHLVGIWNEAAAGDPKAELPAELRSYAALLQALPKKARQRVDQRVTAALLKHVDEHSGPKRLRKRAKELLAS